MHLKAVLIASNLDYSKVSEETIEAVSHDNIIGFNIGGSYEYTHNNLVSLEAGLEINKKGGKNVFDDGEYKINLYFLELPINAKFKYELKNNITAFASIGPYLSMGLTASSSSTTEYNNDLTEVEFGSEVGQIPRFLMGLHIGLGVHYKEYQFGITYDWSLTNLAKNDEETEVEVYLKPLKIYLGYTLPWDFPIFK